VFSPLWHYNQIDEVKELIKMDIKAIITKIAGYGLNRNYLNKLIDKDILSNLIILENKLGFNVAGEGGEYESFVLDCPLFNKKIKVLEFVIKEDNEFTAELFITKAKLIEK
jgi:asparagine synthase (glutamine-hydrolysing)